MAVLLTTIIYIYITEEEQFVTEEKLQYNRNKKGEEKNHIQENQNRTKRAIISPCRFVPYLTDFSTTTGSQKPRQGELKLVIIW